MNLDKLRIFYYAAMAKSFTNCGLNLSPSAVSRHVSDLEYWLKVKLFVRHPKGMELTPQGERLLDTCHIVFKELEGIRQIIASEDSKAEGKLNITTPSGWVATIVVKLIKDFLEDNPDVRLSIKSTDRVPNFARSEADIAMMTFVPEDQNLIGEKMLTFHLGLYASPEYLKQFGVPHSVEELKDHRLVSYGDYDNAISNINWHLGLGMPEGKQREPYLSINSLYYAAEAGYGIVTLAKENVLLQGKKLIQVLPEIEGPSVDAYCVYPKRLEKSKRVQTFIHYLKQQVEQDLWMR